MKYKQRQYFFKVLQGSFSKDFKKLHLFPLRVKLFFVGNVKRMTIMKDLKQGESWKVGNEDFIWWSLLMPEMSGKCKSNPT